MMSPVIVLMTQVMKDMAWHELASPNTVIEYWDIGDVARQSDLEATPPTVKKAPYSNYPNKRAGYNKRAVWNFFKK